MDKKTGWNGSSLSSEKRQASAMTADKPGPHGHSTSLLPLDLVLRSGHRVRAKH